MVRLILDLRDNSGGLLSAAIEVTDIFLERDRLIVRERKRGQTQGFPFCRKSVVFRASRGVVERGKRGASRSWPEPCRFLVEPVWSVSNPLARSSVQTIFPLSDGAGLRRPPCIFCRMARRSTSRALNRTFSFPAVKNETKLRMQRYGDPSLSSREFEELFGFARIQDVQKAKAFDLLTVESNATGPRRNESHDSGYRELLRRNRSFSL